MTHDEIIRMAREAGVDVDTAWGVSDVAIERFATLVAAAEREACAKVCDELAGILLGHKDRAGAEICVSLRDDIRARSNA